jgi:hypothetical protein
MDRLFDIFGHIAEIGIAGLTIAGAPSGRWSSSEARKWIDRYFDKQKHTRKAEQQPNLKAEPLSPRSANRSTAPRAPLRCEVAGWIDHHDPAASASSCR